MRVILICSIFFSFNAAAMQALAEDAFAPLRAGAKEEKERGLPHQSLVTVSKNVNKLYAMAKKVVSTFSTDKENTAWVKSWETRISESELSDSTLVQNFIVCHFSSLFKEEGAYKNLKDEQILSLSRLVVLTVDRKMIIPQKLQELLAVTAAVEDVCVFVAERVNAKTEK